jgi:hypothetical protein
MTSGGDGLQAQRPLSHKAGITLSQLRLSICPNLSAFGTLPWTLVLDLDPLSQQFLEVKYLSTTVVFQLYDS